MFCHSFGDDGGMKRGAMVLINGLVGKPELNGRCGLVLGDLTSNGRVPLGIAPLEPDELLELVAVKPQNAMLAPHPPQVMATAWNNLGFAYKRSNKYVEAGAAYELSLEFSPVEQSGQLINNMVKLCMTMMREQVGDAERLNARMTHLLHVLFEPVTSLPELRGLDCTLGVDFVPGYPQRMLTCGVTSSIDGVPARTTFHRVWCFDPSLGVVEIKPETGERLPMSATAQAALRAHPGKAVRESQLSFNSELVK